MRDTHREIIYADCFPEHCGGHPVPERRGGLGDLPEAGRNCAGGELLVHFHSQSHTVSGQGPWRYVSEAGWNCAGGELLVHFHSQSHTVSG